jgi:hypothetical protein
MGGDTCPHPSACIGSAVPESGSGLAWSLSELGGLVVPLHGNRTQLRFVLTSMVATEEQFALVENRTDVGLGATAVAAVSGVQRFGRESSCHGRAPSWSMGHRLCWWLFLASVQTSNHPMSLPPHGHGLVRYARTRRGVAVVTSVGCEMSRAGAVVGCPYSDTFCLKWHMDLFGESRLRGRSAKARTAAFRGIGCDGAQRAFITGRYPAIMLGGAGTVRRARIQAREEPHP